MHESFFSSLACPVCGGALCPSPTPAPNTCLRTASLDCAGCRASYPVEEGVPRLVPAARRPAVDAFLRAYGQVRAREGWAVESPSYYAELPYRDRSGRHPEEWAARTRSYQALLRRLHGHSQGAPLSLVDVGAGAGWLAARVTEHRHRALALDLDPGPHGLGATPHLAHDGPLLSRAQADMSAPPLAPGRWEVIVLNASLHYARDPGAVLARLGEALAPGGVLVVLDSPLYPSERDRARAAQATARYYQSQGEPQLADSYRGLVRDELRGWLRGYRVEEEVTRPIPVWKGLAGRLLKGYQPGEFSLVWAVKPR